MIYSNLDAFLIFHAILVKLAPNCKAVKNLYFSYKHFFSKFAISFNFSQASAAVQMLHVIDFVMPQLMCDLLRPRQFAHILTAILG